MSLQIPKSTKFIIRPQHIKQLSKPINIFSNPGSQKYESVLDRLKEYFVVGDPDFKRRYCEDRGSQRMNTTIGKFTQLQDTNVNTRYEERTKTEGDLGVEVDCVERGCRTGYGELQKRARKRFQVLKEKERKFNSFLRTRVPRDECDLNKTMTYSRKQIQIVPNPELINLINDNIPEYWQQTLRDNERRLKRHIKGNPFKQTQDTMLQTMKGRKKLVCSIPKLKQQFLDPPQKKNRMAGSGFHTVGSKIVRLRQSIRVNENQTTADIPRLYCEEVYKIHYSPEHRY